MTERNLQAGFWLKFLSQSCQQPAETSSIAAIQGLETHSKAPKLTESLRIMLSMEASIKGEFWRLDVNVPSREG